jgi:hypothetical protein
MNVLQRIAAVAVLSCPMVAAAQGVQRPEWRMYGSDRDEERAGSQPMFFYYMNSGIARLEDGHLLVTTQDVAADELKPVDPDSKAAIRRRAALRIVSGYEPPLAHMIANIEESAELKKLNEQLPMSNFMPRRQQKQYEIDCECRALRVRRAEKLTQSWQDAPPDTSRGALVTKACAAADSTVKARTGAAP